MEDENIITSGDTVTIDLSNYGAAQETYSVSSIDMSTTITLPSINYTMAGSGLQYTTSSGNGTSSVWGSSYYNNDTAVKINTDGIIMKEGSDIKIGGKSLTEAIEKIEERLGILKPNPELEERWEQLKELRRQYIELEQDLLEKEKIMKILKET
jgi:hypothetical protein